MIFLIYFFVNKSFQKNNYYENIVRGNEVVDIDWRDSIESIIEFNDWTSYIISGVWDDFKNYAIYVTMTRDVDVIEEINNMMFMSCKNDFLQREYCNSGALINIASQYNSWANNPTCLLIDPYWFYKEEHNCYLISENLLKRNIDIPVQWMNSDMKVWKLLINIWNQKLKTEISIKRFSL